MTTSDTRVSASARIASAELADGNLIQLTVNTNIDCKGGSAAMVFRQSTVFCDHATAIELVRERALKAIEQGWLADYIESALAMLKQHLINQGIIPKRTANDPT